MSFDEFWDDEVSRGTPPQAEYRRLAESAWDAALCAAGANSLDMGRIREGREVLAEISALHTWNRKPAVEGSVA
jgi:hypothetical protein